jgi:hypothetical protein
MKLSTVQSLRCAASTAVATYFYVRLAFQDLRAVRLDLWSASKKPGSLPVHQRVNWY